MLYYIKYVGSVRTQLFDTLKGINVVGFAQLFDIIKHMLYYIKYVGSVRTQLFNTLKGINIVGFAQLFDIIKQINLLYQKLNVSNNFIFLHQY
jgi:ACT domain-containing protein